MKRVILNILVIAAILLAPIGIATPRSVQAASAITVSSVNFNDSTPGTWSQNGSPVLGYVDDGNGGMALSIQRTNDWDGIQSPAGLLEAGVEYTFSMRARLPADSTVTSTSVRFVVKPNYNWVANTTINAADWTTITGTYTLPTDVDPAAAQIYIGSSNLDPAAPYTILIDDILITRPGAVITISSVNFNDSTPGTWSQNGSPVLGYVDDGNGGMALSIQRTNDWDGIQSPAGLLEAGVEYTFSMRARLPADSTVASTSVRFVVKPNYNWVANTTINAADWTTITGTYTLPTDVDPAAAQIYIGSSNLDPAAPYTILIDDILITRTVAIKTISAVNFNDSTPGTWSQNGSPVLGYVDDGNGGMALSIQRTNDWDGIQSPAGLLEAGVEYTFSMRARLPADSTVASTSVRFVVKPNYNWVANTTINAADWTMITGTYTLPTDVDPAAAQIYIGSSNLDPAAPYTILIDDILITAPDTGGGGGTGVLDSDCSNGYIALTFDDGPYAGQTDQLITALEAARLRATFFDWGEHIAGNESLVQAQFANGWVGNHSWTHRDLTTLTEAEITQELTDTQNALQAITGQAPVLFRPPYLASNDTVRSIAASLGLTEIMADVDSRDWAGVDTATIVANVSAARSGDVVLMHDNLATTRAAIPRIADFMTARKLCPGMINPATGDAVAPPAQTVIDTDFEDGWDGWVVREADSTPATLTLTEAESHSPTHAALVSDRDGQGDGIGHDVTGIMKPGTTYIITAWVKFASGSPAGELWLSMRRTNSGTDSFDTIGQFENTPGDSWRQVTVTYQMGVADAAFIYFETTWPDGTTEPFLVDDIKIEEQGGANWDPSLTPLKDTVDFPVGVAIDSRETTGAYSGLLQHHFNQITPENHMKPDAWYDTNRNFRIHPEAKLLMDYAAANGIRVYGHTLLWHQQTPEWFFQRDDGTPLTNAAADQEILRTRLHDHIFNVASTLSSMYGPFGSATNPIVAFDVANEVISDSPESDGLRRSPYYNVLGPSYIDDAFTWANQAFNVDYAAPGVTRPVALVLNDYNTEQAAKRQRLHNLVVDLLSRDIPINVVGHQFHVSLTTPIQGLDDALTAFEDLPVMQVVTELDVMTGTPVDDARLIEQGYYYRDAFRFFRAHAASIYSVTIWGLYDSRSWRSSNAPLLFNAQLAAKPAYYGAVDQALPARIRTALVFQADVPLEVGATSALEWQKLRLHTAGDKLSFQLRWQSDHLSAFIDAKDATPEAADRLAFVVGDSTYVFNRDGSGDVPGIIEEGTGGWKAVVHLPLSSAQQDDQVQFNVALTDGAETIGWNDPGATGTLTLAEPLSYLEVAGIGGGAAPVIDGSVDAIWALAGTVTTGKQISGTDTASADVKTLWQGNSLYVLAHVHDAVLDDAASDPWQKDSVEIYVDAGNYKNGTYRPDDAQIRINFKNETSFGTGDTAAQQARLVSATQVVDDGYIVEASISLLEESGAGTFHGLDFQVNDAASGARVGMRNWADPTNAGYLSTSHWGVGRLLEADLTVPELHFLTPIDLTATAGDGYHGLTAAIAGVTATDAFDDPSWLTITSDAPAVLPIGTNVVTWTATDLSGNTSSLQQTIIIHARVLTSLRIAGSRTAMIVPKKKANYYTAGAVLSAKDRACVVGQPVRFTLDRDPLTGEAVTTTLGTTLVDSAGKAKLQVAIDKWMVGTYTLTAIYDGNNLGCVGTSVSEMITVAVAPPKATSGVTLAIFTLLLAIPPKKVRL